MKILAVCLSPELRQKISEIAAQAEWTNVDTADQFVNDYEKWADGQFHVITVGAEGGLDFIFEAGQVARNQCPLTPLINVIDKKDMYYPKRALKNGFKESVLLPQDQGRLKDILMNSAAGDIKSRVYKRVKAFDLQPDTQLTFDTFIYLPMNDKHIKFSKANTNLDKRKVDKLAEHNVQNLFIQNSDAEAFYQHTAEQLSQTSKNGNFMSATEREEKAGELIKEIFSSVFDKEDSQSFESGQEIVSMCQKIISNMVTGGADSNWYNKISHSLSGQMDDYAHATETSTLASFFALAMGIEKIEDIAIAAFLHDLGMTDVIDFDPENPEHLKDEKKLKIYQTHPERSLEYIKGKRMIISEKVTKTIASHHERFDGQGFPKKLSGDRILIEAQILSLADQFQYLTSIRPGKVRLNPQEALKSIFKNGSLTPAIASKLSKIMG